MRYVSINGAVFIFLQRGEKLKENEGLPLNGIPDHRYVLWPRGDYWDVREKVLQSGGFSWEPIENKPFRDENTAWQAAYEHWMKRCEQVYRFLRGQKGDSDLYN